MGECIALDAPPAARMCAFLVCWAPFPVPLAQSDVQLIVGGGQWVRQTWTCCSIKSVWLWL